MKARRILNKLGSRLAMVSAAALCVCVFDAGPSAAEDSVRDEGVYLGVFGGVGTSFATRLQQRGKVHISERFSLPINALGSTSNANVKLGGIQLGYEGQWRADGSGWALKPSVQLEGIYIGEHSPVGEMPVHPSALGTQYVTVPTRVGLGMANAMFTFDTPYSDRIFPYLGVGVGVALVSIKGSDSANPMEPGINHFNSDPDASDTAFAMQMKVGLKARVNKNLHLFTEYRYLTIDNTRYSFGATDYPDRHLPTDAWQVDMGRQEYNLFVVGLQYRF